MEERQVEPHAMSQSLLMAECEQHGLQSAEHFFLSNLPRLTGGSQIVLESKKIPAQHNSIPYLFVSHPVGCVVVPVVRAHSAARPSKLGGTACFLEQCIVGGLEPQRRNAKLDARRMGGWRRLDLTEQCHDSLSECHPCGSKIRDCCPTLTWKHRSRAKAGMLCWGFSRRIGPDD